MLNFKAFFFIDKEHIKGKYRFFGKIDCSISDVVFALGRNGTLIIQLKDGKTHTITQIENAWRLASVIRRNMPFDVSDPPKTLIEELNKLKSGRKKGILCVFFGLALMFINIFITVFLTGEREMHEFNKTDWTVFTFMCAIEIATVVATFYFAGKAGKNNIPIERLKYCIQRTVIESYPLLPGFVIAVYADEDYTARITLFGYPQDSAVYYSVQNLDAEYNPVHQYTSEVFENQEGLSEEFSSLIDITEKVLHKNTKAR